jgi:hypothetical protein
VVVFFSQEKYGCGFNDGIIIIIYYLKSKDTGLQGLEDTPDLR